MKGNRYMEMITSLLEARHETLAEIDSLLAQYPEIERMPDAAALADLLAELADDLEERAQALLVVEGAKDGYRVCRGLSLWLRDKAHALHGVVVLASEAPASRAARG